jgi:hypothetical protein
MKPPNKAQHIKLELFKTGRTPGPKFMSAFSRSKPEGVNLSGLKDVAEMDSNAA